MSENTCVCCNESIPEGMMVCKICESSLCEVTDSDYEESEEEYE